MTTSYNNNGLLPRFPQFGIAPDDVEQARCCKCSDYFDYHAEQHQAKRVGCVPELVAPEFCPDCQEESELELCTRCNRRVPEPEIGFYPTGNICIDCEEKECG